MSDINYEMSIYYNYDRNRDEIIETRSIKRTLENNCTQYLKSNIRNQKSSSISTKIYESVKKRGIVTFNLKLPEEHIEKVMDSKYDLFNYGKEYFNKDTSFIYEGIFI